MERLYSKFTDYLKDTLALYNRIQGQRVLVASTSALLRERATRLERAMNETEVARRQLTWLRSSWFRRSFRKAQIKEAESEFDRRADAAKNLEVEVKSAKSLLDDATAKEVLFISEFRLSIESVEPVIRKADGARKVANEFGYPIPVVGFKNSVFGYSTLLKKLMEDEKELLSSVIRKDAFETFIFLVAYTYIRETEGIDCIAERFREAIGDKESKLDSLRRKKRDFAEIDVRYEEADKFLKENALHLDSWKAKIAELVGLISKTNGEISRLEAELQGLAEKVVSEARLLGVTMVRASYDKRFADFKFDALVVDEFSTVSLPQLYCVACLARERFILSGDHLQLPPISISESRKTKNTTGKKKWLAHSFYDWHVIENKDKVKGLRVPLVVQNRMPPEISELVRPWYKNEDNPLEDNWHDKHGEKLTAVKSPLLNSRVIVLDSTETNAYSSRSPSKSYYNLIHAGIVGAVVRGLVEEAGLDPKMVRCITPYRDQAALTRAVLRQLCPDMADQVEAIASTIHQCQGRGHAIVIYDLTDGAQQRLSGFNRLEEPNLLNVALTRAEAHLIILCSYAKMKRALEQEPSAALRHIIRMLEQNHVPVASAKPYADQVFKEISMDVLLSDAVVTLNEEQKSNILVLRAPEYYAALAHDFSNATESILIVCPFITPYRMEKMKPMIQAVRHRSGDKVRIELVTRDPARMFDRKRGDDHKGCSVRCILDDLTNLRVKVTVSPDAHGKLVVVDNRVNYWGSINPLSWRDTDEINTRLEAQELSKKLIQLVRTGRSWPYKPSGLQYSKQEIRSDYQSIARRLLRDLGWSISGLYHAPRMRVMWNRTIEELVTNPPKTWEDYLRIEQISRRNSLLRKHLRQIEDIIYPLRGRRLPPRDRPAQGTSESTLFD